VPKIKLVGMLCQNAIAYQQINMFFNDKVQSRRSGIQKAITIIGEVIQDVLKHVEQLVSNRVIV
jgi:hypothetical protein